MINKEKQELKELIREVVKYKIMTMSLIIQI